MTQSQSTTASTRSKSHAGINMAPNSEPLIPTQTIQRRFEDARGYYPNTTQLSSVLVAGVVHLQQLREQRRLSSISEQRHELTASIEGLLTDICELLSLEPVKKHAASSLFKNRKHPASRLLLEESDESSKQLRVKRFDDELTKERRTLAGIYGAKRDRMLALERQLHRNDEGLSPDQRRELAVCMHRFAALKERQGDRLRAEPMLETANKTARGFGPQAFGWYEESITRSYGIDLKSSH